MEKILNVWNNNKGIIKKVLIGGAVVVALKLVAGAVTGSSDTEEDCYDVEPDTESEPVAEA